MAILYYLLIPIFISIFMKHSRLKCSIQAVFLAMLALASLLSTHLRAETPAMLVKTELHSLTVDRLNPGSFKAEMAMEFRWNPKELPNFDFDPFVFLNSIGEVYQQTTLLPPRRSDGYVGALLLLRGSFACANDFAAYPFNHSRFSIVARKLRGDFHLVEEEKGAGVGIYQNVKPLSYNFTVKKTGFLTGEYVPMWHSDKDFDKIQGVPSICYFIDTEHKPQRSLLMIFLPLLLIWGITYTSQWWKDESASSRAIMASLFSVITLTFSAVNLQPDVSYFTAMNWAFAAYYLNLLTLGTLTVMAFRENKRGDVVSFRFHRRIGRILGIILLIVSTLAIAEWVHHKRNLPQPPWLFHAA
jgi:hypothetical protein